MNGYNNYFQIYFTLNLNSKRLSGLRTKVYVSSVSLILKSKQWKLTDLSMVSLLDDIFPLLFMMML